MVRTPKSGNAIWRQVYKRMQDNFKSFLDELEGVHEQWDKDVLDFARKVFELVTPAAEVRCPKDMEALVWQDVQEIISLRGSQESRAYLRKLLSTWHEGECCQCLAAGPCACLRNHIGASKQINDIHGATCTECKFR